LNPRNIDRNKDCKSPNNLSNFRSNVRTSNDDHDHSFETHEKDELLYEDLSVGI
jgi:hypothetical protein